MLNFSAKCHKIPNATKNTNLEFLRSVVETNEIIK